MTKRERRSLPDCARRVKNERDEGNEKENKGTQGTRRGERGRGEGWKGREVRGALVKGFGMGMHDARSEITGFAEPAIMAL